MDFVLSIDNELVV